jgi:hypothetical protein
MLPGQRTSRLNSPARMPFFVLHDSTTPAFEATGMATPIAFCVRWDYTVKCTGFLCLASTS